VRLRVSVDGRRVFDERFAPKGLWNDGNSVAIAPLAVEPGEHEVLVEIADGHDDDVWSYRSEQSLRFDASARRVIAFDRVAGFTVH
jgi:hypothetical protein